MCNNVFIVAEMSANHNGSIKIAIDTIKAAKQVGADAIKFQTYTADTLTLNSDKADFCTNPKGLWANRRYYDVYKEGSMPWEWHEELYRVAKEEGIIAFSSPFDKTAVDLLETLDNPIYKIASPEITDIPLIEYTAKKMKPIVISTGVATKEDIDLAVATCKGVGNNDITILKCTTAYPTPISECNLLMIPELANEYKVKVGLSDHTTGFVAPMIATALGATMIEKHFIIDRNQGGVDAAFSTDMNEFSEMVKMVRDSELSLGSVSFELTELMQSGRRALRSLYIAQDVKAGNIITEENVRSVRPGFGLHPKHFNAILGKKFRVDASKGDRMSLEMVEQESQQLSTKECDSSTHG